MAQSDTKVDNGVNVEALLEARKALTDAPEAAQFQWRATCKWLNGTHSESTIQKFFGLAPSRVTRRNSLSMPTIRDLRLGRRGATPVGIRPCGLGKLPDRRYRRGRSEPRDTTAPRSPQRLKAGWTYKAFSASTGMCETASTASRLNTRSTPTRRKTRSKPFVAQSQKRSASTTSSPTQPMSGRGELTRASSATSERSRSHDHHRRHRRRTCRVGHQPVPHRPLHRARGARAREVANSWRTERWDSLRLLTPNWQSRLPGYGYEGDDPDGFRTMPEIVAFIDCYARVISAPVQTHTRVTRCAAPTPDIGDHRPRRVALPGGRTGHRRVQRRMRSACAAAFPLRCGPSRR